LAVAAKLMVMPELGHDILAALVAMLAVAIFALMIWAGRAH
jgi:hypothetical protein